MAAPGADATPLYQRLYAQLREHILSGALPAGSRLPSARTLAADLTLSRNTVEAALAQLRAEGFIERRIGSGTVVAATMPDTAPFGRIRPAARARTEAAAATRVRPKPGRLSSRGAAIRDAGRAELEADAIVGAWATDLEAFPRAAWRRLLTRRAREAGTATLEAADAAGLPALRRAIAEHVRLTRGVRCDVEQVVVVSSTQQAIDLASRLVLDPGDLAVVEEPQYACARGALLASGATLAGVPVDADGIVASALEAYRDARLLYVTPSHQFPLGVTMSLARRLAILSWAAATGAWILEDDYDSEFRYDGRPLAALQGLDTADRVIYVGSFNKSLFPGLRLAYVVAPPTLAPAVAAARRIADGSSPPLLQATLADFLAAGHYAAHLRQARRFYANCRDALKREVEAHWGGRVRVGPADAGLHLVVHLPRGTDDVAVARAAGGHGLGVGALSRYYLASRAPRGLLLSYGAASPEVIVRAVAALAPLVRRATAGTTRA